MGDWLSLQEVADLLEVSRSTVLRTFTDPDAADKVWGAGNWREKPLTSRRIYQVRRQAAERLAKRQ